MINKCGIILTLVLSSCTAPATATVDTPRGQIIEVCKRSSLSSGEIYDSFERGQLTMKDINYIVDSRIEEGHPVGEHIKEVSQKYFDGEYHSKEEFVYDAYQFCVNQAGLNGE